MLSYGKENSSLRIQSWVKPLLVAPESDEVWKMKPLWADGLQVTLGLGLLTTYG